MSNKQHTEQAAPKKTNNRFMVVLIVLVLGGGGFGISKYLHGQHHEETEDAQIDANISPVIPRTSGYVTDIRVKDNQPVKKGDTLVVLDNRSQLIQVAQMEAALANAESSLSVANASTNASRANIQSVEANVTTADAQIEAAKITLRRASQDFERYANLIKDHSITQQQYEQAEAAKLTAERQLQVLNNQRNAAIRQTSTATSQSNATAQQVNVANATIRQRKADLENAKLNLSYTVVTAPEDGVTSKINVQLGQLVQPGQSLFSIVHAHQPWVVANFKETQIAKMHPGQLVTIQVDAVPGHEFQGKVASFAPATGSRFALLPPDNASGNFVKVVQRLPVKIELDGNDPKTKELCPGMNVDVDVHVN